MAYVTEDGNYGSDEILTFKDEDLTAEQWENLDALSDSTRFDYVSAILNGEDTSEWEE